MSLLKLFMATSQSANSGGGGGSGGGESNVPPIYPLEMNTYVIGEPTWEITYGVDITCTEPLPSDVMLQIAFDEPNYEDGPYYEDWITLTAGETSWTFEFTFANNALLPQEVYACARAIDDGECLIVPSCIYGWYYEQDGLLSYSIIDTLAMNLGNYGNFTVELPIQKINAFGFDANVLACVLTIDNGSCSIEWHFDNGLYGIGDSTTVSLLSDIL